MLTKIQAQAEKDKADEMVASLTASITAMQQMKADYAAKAKDIYLRQVRGRSHVTTLCEMFHSLLRAVRSAFTRHD